MDGLMHKQVAFGGIEVTVPPYWYEITDEVEADDPPFTLADSEGVGALQFSIALYHGGVLPACSSKELRDMALDFGEDRNLNEPFDERLFESATLRGAGLSFRWADNFVRTWYVSDGRNIAFITYVCEWDDQDRELPICENIVESLKFCLR